MSARDDLARAWAERNREAFAKAYYERRNELNKHEHEPTDEVGNPCKVCGFDRHHPWHQ